MPYFMSREGIKLRNAVTKGTVAIDNPHVAVRATELGSQGESPSHSQRPEGSGVQPVQRAPGSGGERRKREYRKTCLVHHLCKPTPV